MRLAIVLILLLAGLPLEAAAAPSDVRLRDYIHTTWTQYEGVPLGFIDRILQTSDGYLWVLVRDALLRFDGMRFVRRSTPCTQRISDIARAVDGGFWAICGEKLIRRTAAGRFVEAPERQASSGRLLTDHEGRLWIFDRTIRYVEPDGTGGRVVPTPAVQGSFTAAEDSEGTLWASGGRNLYQLHPDRVDFISALRVDCFTPSRTGGVFASAENRIWHLRRDAQPTPVADLPVSGLQHCMREAEDGGLWIAARPSGLVLLQSGRVETLADPATVDSLVTYMFSDREGAMWVGTTGSLHRFRKPTVQRIRLSSEHGIPLFVFVDSRENLWTGSDRALSYSNLRDGTTSPAVTPQDVYTAIGEDEKGTVWVSNEKAIGYVANGTFVAVADATGAPVAKVYAFKQDHRGHLWALSRRVGVYRVTPGPPRLELASPQAAIRFLVSERSGLWMGIEGGGVEQYLNGRTTAFSKPNPALRVDPSPRTLLEDGDSLWVGSYTGLERLRNGTWTTWTRGHGLPGNGAVKEMIADRSGHFWIMTGGGLLRLPRAQLDATPDGSPKTLSFARIGILDGVVPHPGTLAPSPQVTSDRTGRLFFTTQDAIVAVDPSAVSESSMIPPIVLESVVVDNEPVDDTATNSFVEPSRLQFDYTSLSLLSPENARFRYRLDPYDADWVEAGGERRVTYGTLRPGAYRFHVIGAGSEGVWNDTGASFAFRIVPVFWRTWWFRITMVALGLSIAGGLYRLRVRQLTRQFNVRLDARVGERTRIARDLHDTLLQSFQGVLIHFQAATNLLPGRPDEAKRRFESVLEQAARAVTEGRDAVQALRESAGTSDDLPHTLSVLADQLVDDAGPGPAAAFRVNVEGTPRRLRPVVRDDVYRIASEAMRNAMRHARARQIQVDVHYDQRCLRLRVRDDGTGIDAAILEGRGISGHWGLPGMRERAELIGGTLDVRSRLGAGTEIELSLPASKAYGATRGRRGFRSRNHDWPAP